jgi:hypothetical protein
VYYLSIKIKGIMVKCSISEHLKFVYQLKSDDYKKMFVNAKVKSDDELLKMSETLKNKHKENIP